MTEKEFQVKTGLVVKSCITCGVRFAVPSAFIEKRREDHKTFYCPNGHTMYYPHENKEEILSRELEKAEYCCKIQTAKANVLDYQKRYYKGRLNKLRKEEVAIT